MYSDGQLASDGVKPVIVTAFLHLVHLIDRHCGSRYAAQKHLITGEISSTDVMFKLRQRDVLDLHVAALLISDTLFRFGLIERVSTALGACLRVEVRAFFGRWCSWGFQPDLLSRYWMKVLKKDPT